jgi:hypothetical protein
MQATGSLRTVRMSSVQLVMLAIVAVTGIAFGRWVIPAADSSAPVITRSSEATATNNSANILDRKLVQMDAWDGAHAAGASAVTGNTAGTDALIDQANVAPVLPSSSGPGAAIPQTSDTSSGEALVDLANVAPIPFFSADASRSDLLDRKFAQMDAQDAR